MHSLEIINARNAEKPTVREVGTKFVFKETQPTFYIQSRGDIIIGKIYEIAGIDEDGDEYFIDEAGDKDYAVASASEFKQGVHYEFKDC